MNNAVTTKNIIKTAKDYTIGQTVTVAPAYMGSGRYGSDGWVGTYYVVGHCGDRDLKLARHAGTSYDVIVNLSRIVGSGSDHCPANVLEQYGIKC